MPPIAKVEPLTTARALHGPFDYRLPEAMSDVGVGSVLVVPFGRQRLLGVVVATAESSQLPPQRLVEPIEALEAGVPPELVELGLKVAEEYCSTAARGLSLVLPPGIGTRSTAKLRVKERQRLHVVLTKLGQRALIDGGIRLGGRQRQLLEALTLGPKSVTTLNNEIGVDHGSVRRLEARGLVEVRPIRVRRRPRDAPVGALQKRVVLTAEQREAVAKLTDALSSDNGGKRFLLHGVTGSGKTEVYLQVARAALERRSSVIVLVPEIALTPQTVARFKERFGERVAVLHSRMGQGERYDEWRRLREGQANVCVGPRSAIFAPLSDLGLIVIDEEHDSSYKQEGDPRYDARRVAELRAKQSGALLVVGSATPRAESWQRLPRIRLPSRVDGLDLPAVELLDMCAVHTSLHPRTRLAIEAVRDRAEKAVVLLNRRGWSAFLSCRECGYVRDCRHCDVSLTLHRSHGSSDRLVCHHCGYSEEAGNRCPSCGSISVARHGAGTERLESELRAAFDPLPVFRLDSDSAVGKNSVAEVLGGFDRAECGVLLGTQMVAKGHDFPSVTLGVVLGADSTLHFPDFRAEERTFALIAQLAGRSGRGPGGGKVLVQTLAPQATSIRFAACHDAEGFLNDELERRRSLGYPPFGELARLVCSGTDQDRVEQAALDLRRGLDRPNLEVLGPAPLFRLKGNHRMQLMIKAGDLTCMTEAVRAALAGVTGDKRHRGVRFAADIDPQ